MAATTAALMRIEAPINVNANCHWRRVSRLRLKGGKYSWAGCGSSALPYELPTASPAGFVSPVSAPDALPAEIVGFSLSPEESPCALSSPDCGKFVSIIRFYRQTILTQSTLAVLLPKALLASSAEHHAKSAELPAKKPVPAQPAQPAAGQPAASPEPAFWRGASRRLRDPFRPHRPKQGRGRSPLKRLASLAGIATIIITLGLLLAAFVVLCAVIGVFLVETIIGT